MGGCPLQNLSQTQLLRGVLNQLTENKSSLKITPTASSNLVGPSFTGQDIRLDTGLTVEQDGLLVWSLLLKDASR